MQIMKGRRFIQFDNTQLCSFSSLSMSDTHQYSCLPISQPMLMEIELMQFYHCIHKLFRVQEQSLLPNQDEIFSINP